MRKRDILRIIDVNLNRLREAIRVCEDVTRFIIEDKNSTLKLKKIRHEILTVLSKSKNLKSVSLILSRDTRGDIGKQTISQELKRNGSSGILSANLQRAKESVRVLEEFFKVIDQRLAFQFKKIRFKIYNLEKVLIEKLESTGNLR